jgi:outer membrane protein assembly factor BamB
MPSRAAGLVAVPLLTLVMAAAPAAQGGDDWPQWRGPRRDGVSRETGLLTRWPRTGPPLAWSAEGLGAGYGSIAVQGGRVFVQGMRDAGSVVMSLDAGTGARVWTTPIGRSRTNDRGSGPRGTPTVDGDRLYVLTENGDLACLQVEDGRIVWQRNVLETFGGRNINWLVSESPLVDGDHVIVSPGGRGAGMAALDKMTGETVWESGALSDEAGYASPVVADVQGVRSIMTLTSRGGVGVRASDGTLMWRYDRVANQTANIATPVVDADRVFFTSSYGAGGVLLQLRREGDEVRAEEVYFTSSMQNHHGGVVLLDGYLYGYNNSILTCLEFATGRVLWRDRSVGKGSITAADGHLYVLSEDNRVALVEATPDGYREKGRFSVPDQGLPSWAHPVVSGGRLYIRNQDVLTSYDVHAE